MTTDLLVVSAITYRGGEKMLSRVGVAFVNKDGSLSLKLEAMPVNGELHVEKAPPSPPPESVTNMPDDPSRCEFCWKPRCACPPRPAMQGPTVPSDDDLLELELQTLQRVPDDRAARRAIYELGVAHALRPDRKPEP